MVINLYPYFLEPSDAIRLRAQVSIRPYSHSHDETQCQINVTFNALFKTILMGKGKNNVGC